MYFGTGRKANSQTWPLALVILGKPDSQCCPECFPVTLTLTGVANASFQVTEGVNRITVEIPRGLAIKLGLLPGDPTVDATEAR